jgi:hypothetical protein
MWNLKLLCAAAAIIAATPAAAHAQNIAYGTKSPIAISSFRVNEVYTPGTIGTELEQAPQFVADGIGIKFINTGDVAATRVKFFVTAGRSTQTVVDQGTFSPGVPIKHNFTVADPFDLISGAACNVAEVVFADGSVWRPEPGVASR